MQGDFNQTTDAALWVVGDFSRPLPVLKGSSFELWSPDAGRKHGSANEGDIRKRAEEKLARQVRLRSSAYFGMNPKELIGTHNLSFERPRIAFRDVARATDSRTVIAALVPRVVLTNKAPYLMRREGDARAEAFLLAVLSSIPLDWYARRYVEMSLNFFILKSLPIPLYVPGNRIADRVVQAAGRLAAVDDRYADWAGEVGVSVGSVETQTEKDDLIVELDAAVSLLYGLTEDQVEHMFATFHRGWDYEPRLTKVLGHYRKWKGKA